MFSKITAILTYSLIAGLIAPSFASAEKYPDCKKGQPLKEGDKFSVYVDTPKVKKDELPKLLSKVGAQTTFRAKYPEFGTDGTMWIDVEIMKSMNNPVADPKEFDRLVKSELAKVSDLPVTINCR